MKQTPAGTAEAEQTKGCRHGHNPLYPLFCKSLRQTALSNTAKFSSLSWFFPRSPSTTRFGSEVTIYKSQSQIRGLKQQVSSLLPSHGTVTWLFREFLCSLASPLHLFGGFQKIRSHTLTAFPPQCFTVWDAWEAELPVLHCSFKTSCSLISLKSFSPGYISVFFDLTTLTALSSPCWVLQVGSSEQTSQRCTNKESEGAASHPLLMGMDYISRDLHTSWNGSHSLTLLWPDKTTVLLVPWKHQDSGLHCEPRLHLGEEGENGKKSLRWHRKTIHPIEKKAQNLIETELAA